MKPARHRLHRELREIVEDTSQLQADLELIADRFSPLAYALVRCAVLMEAQRRLIHIVDRLEEGQP